MKTEWAGLTVKLTVRDLSESRIVHLKTSDKNGADADAD
jgi:hypothetical protein